MQESVIVLGYHVTSVNTDTTNFKCSPNRVTGEQLVVGLDTSELNHTELHNYMIDELLSLLLCKDTGLHI